MDPISGLALFLLDSLTCFFGGKTAAAVEIFKAVSALAISAKSKFGFCSVL